MSTLYKEGQEMHDLASELWPLPRSLTGEGTRQTLAKFLMLNPDMKVENFRTGDRVFDWTIPKQWDVRNCYLEHESGQRFAEFSKKNLHVEAVDPLVHSIGKIKIKKLNNINLNKFELIIYLVNHDILNQKFSNLKKGKDKILDIFNYLK